MAFGIRYSSNSVKMSESRTSGQGGLAVIKSPTISFRYCPPLSTKGVSKPQPNLSEMPTASQAKEKSFMRNFQELQIDY